MTLCTCQIQQARDAGTKAAREDRAANRVSRYMMACQNECNQWAREAAQAYAKERRRNV